MDDNIDDDFLRAILEKNNCEVISPRKVRMSGRSDKEHAEYAALQEAVVLTSDRRFSRGIADHAGILIIYKYNNPKKDLSVEKIVRALQNIVRLGIDLKKRVYKLNDFNF